MVWTIERRREDVRLGEKNITNCVWRTLKQNEFFVMQQRFDMCFNYTTVGYDSPRKQSNIEYPYLLQPTLMKDNTCLWCIDDKEENNKICLLCSENAYRICTASSNSIVIAKATEETEISSNWTCLESLFIPPTNNDNENDNVNDKEKKDNEDGCNKGGENDGNNYTNVLLKKISQIIVIQNLHKTKEFISSSLPFNIHFVNFQFKYDNNINNNNNNNNNISNTNANTNTINDRLSLTSSSNSNLNSSFSNLLKEIISSSQTNNNNDTKNKFQNDKLYQAMLRKIASNEYFHTSFPNIPIGESLSHCLFLIFGYSF